jgi:hypothetical protein
MARTMLVHAHRRWPTAICRQDSKRCDQHDPRSKVPVCYSNGKRRHQHDPQSKVPGSQNTSRIFQSSKVTTNPKHWHHSGCPVNVLSSNLQQAGGIHHKWKERSKLGVYLGRSPQHARTVALVLDMETGFVSPQFHVKFDPTFQTTRKRGRQPASSWQQKCGFVTEGTSM